MLYLAKRSPQTAKEITQGLRMSKKKLSPILSSLQEKGVVFSCFKPVDSVFSCLNRESDRYSSEKKRESSKIYQRSQRRINSLLAKNGNTK